MNIEYVGLFLFRIECRFWIGWLNERKEKELKRMKLRSSIKHTDWSELKHGKILHNYHFQLKWTTRRIMCWTVLFIVYQILLSFSRPFSIPSTYFLQVLLFNSMILMSFHSIFPRCSEFPRKRFTKKNIIMPAMSGIFFLSVFLKIYSYIECAVCAMHGVRCVNEFLHIEIWLCVSRDKFMISFSMWNNMPIAMAFDIRLVDFI